VNGVHCYIIDAFTEFLFLAKIIAAAVLGGLVGLEREAAERPAGLRTHMLVCGTSALLVILANLMVASFEQKNLITADPVRVMEAIVVGISFLGAGTILKHSRESTVEGLTTSASILSVAAIGIAVALNAFLLAIGVTLLNLFINWGVAYIANRVNLKANINSKND
jgi:putative Mg2+ transporter-C (MgtC) family protein